MRIDADGPFAGRTPAICLKPAAHPDLCAISAGLVVLHPHSVNATVLSMMSFDSLLLQDYELLKAFPGGHA